MNTRNDQIEQARRLIATGISEDLKEVLEKQFPELKGNKDKSIRDELHKIIVMAIQNENLPDKERDFISLSVVPYVAYLERQKDAIGAARQQGYEEGLEDGIKMNMAEQMCESKEWADELGAEIDRISKRYPEVSFAKLSRVAIHFVRWQKEQEHVKCLKPKKDCWYVCIKDFYGGGKKQSSKGDLVQAKGGMYMMGRDDISEWFRKAYYDEIKPAEWSEEDRKHLDWIIEHFRQDCVLYVALIYWLEQLPKRFNLQPKQEWSEVDERDIQWASDICRRIGEGCDPQIDSECAKGLSERLKSLRPQPKEDIAAIAKREYERGKRDGHWEGYKKAQEDMSLHYDLTTFPSIGCSCLEGGSCTNPQMDCINCPRRNGSGTYKYRFYFAKGESKLEAHWKPSEEQIGILGKVFAGCQLKDSERDSMVDLFNHLKDMI